MQASIQLAKSVSYHKGCLECLEHHVARACDRTNDRVHSIVAELLAGDFADAKIVLVLCQAPMFVLDNSISDCTFVRVCFASTA